MSPTSAITSPVTAVGCGLVVDCVAAAERDVDAIGFLDKRVMSGPPFLSAHFEKAAVELHETADEQSCE